MALCCEKSLQGQHGMCNGFFGKAGLYFAPQTFEEIAEPVVVECSFVFPKADGEKNIWLMNVLISLQAYATLHMGNAGPVLLKDYLKCFCKFRLKSELYYSGNGRLHGKLSVGEYYSYGLVKHALFHQFGVGKVAKSLQAQQAGCITFIYGELEVSGTVKKSQ